MTVLHLSLDDDWAAERTVGLPARWRHSVMREYESVRSSKVPDARRASNLFLRKITDQLVSVRLPLNATDAEICERAEQCAAECVALGSAFHDVSALRNAMARVVERYGCDAPETPWIDANSGELHGVRDLPAIKRMTDNLWWRRALRRMHAQRVEAAAIELGFVNATRDLYVSNESLWRRGQQNQRVEAMLEATLATNEEGDTYSLAELKAKSTSNKKIRRAELMTRIAGFEQIARDLDHVGLFFTVTCPSRMHKWRKVGDGVRPNPNYDGTKPNEAQAYLAKMFTRLRAKLARAGVNWYGFRIAEPNHDGTPHWHVLVFFDPQWNADVRRAAMPRVCAIVRQYALQDSPGELGAKSHRANFKQIDWSKGSAAGYIAKYVSKNIDGDAVGDDFYGNPAHESATRVDAWAATWRIRQFQQIGGPPVGIWRELRRIKSLENSVPEELARAHAAVNKTDTSGASWGGFVSANGGIECPRADRPIQLYREPDDREGRYGEPMGEVVRGVRARGRIHYSKVPPDDRQKWIEVVVRSGRHAWTIKSRGANAGSLGVERGHRAPWTRVNNCTRDAAEGLPQNMEIHRYQRE